MFIFNNIIMYFKAIKGKNYKNFILICDIKTQKDTELYEVVKKILTRSEYQKFGSAKGKTITYTYLQNELIFPSTFWREVKEKIAIHQNNVEPFCENEEILYNQEIDEEEFYQWVSDSKFPAEINTSAKEYFFQQQAAYYAIKNFVSRCEISMGGGKTFTSFLIIKFLMHYTNLIPKGKKVLIILTQSNLIKQFQNEYIAFDTYFDNKLKVETVTSNPKKIAECDVLIGHFKTLSTYDVDFLNEFHIGIFDEVHRAKAYTIRNEVHTKLLQCEFMFAMTGTMPEYKLLDFLHIGMMFDSTPTLIQTMQDNVKNKITTPVIVQVIQIKYKNHSDFSKNLIKEKIIGVEKYIAEKNFIKTYEPRTNLLTKLFKHKTENSLIAVESVEYCEFLKKFISERLPNWTIEILHGEIKEKERERIVNAMRNCDSHYCIIGTKQLVATGLSIKSLQNIYNIEGGKSEILLKQLLCRGNRLFTNKPFFTFFDFQDMIEKSALRQQSIARNKIYRSEELTVEITEISI